jgi:hypothetical protein
MNTENQNPESPKMAATKEVIEPTHIVAKSKEELLRKIAELLPENLVKASVALSGIITTKLEQPKP